MIGQATKTVSSQGIKRWTSKEVAHYLTPKDRLGIFLPTLSALTLCSKQMIRHTRSVPVSRSSRVLGQHGTPTRWDRPRSSRLVADLHSALGGAIGQIRPGDVVWFEPGEKHWHGATPTTAMTHIAIQVRNNSKVSPWTGWKSSATTNTSPEREVRQFDL
jgi:hypothetical protein